MSESTPKPTFTLEERIDIVKKQILTHDWQSLIELREQMIKKEPKFGPLFDYKNRLFNHGAPIYRTLQKLGELSDVDWKEENGQFFINYFQKVANLFLSHYQAAMTQNQLRLGTELFVSQGKLLVYDCCQKGIL
jgi:hypothetical protein